MADSKHLRIRDARDRLIDLLGFGETYPLQDLVVRDEKLTVPFDQSAKIPVEPSQRGVQYQLRDPRTSALVEREVNGEQRPAQLDGNGGTLILETPRVQEDITYKIRAEKLQSGRAAYLHQTATVKVGLDTTLAARILEVQLLDPTDDNPADDSPRIIDYGEQVDVVVENSQEGVDYRLVTVAADGAYTTLSEADVLGNLHDIVLRTGPVHEDIDIRVLATKEFDASDDRDTQQSLLEIALPLEVRANRAVPVSLVPEPVVAHAGSVTIELDRTQRSTNYRVFTRAIADAEYVHTPQPGVGESDPLLDPAILSEADPRRTARVRRPPLPPLWQDIPGFVPLGDSRPGTGGKLQFTAGGLTLDVAIIVQAQKDHQAAQIVSSAVQLEQAAAVFVRPDPEPQLGFEMSIANGQTDGPLRVVDGQPGVLYSVRTSADGDDLGRPVYIHQRDPGDAAVNKGVGQLKLGIDLAIARAPDAGAAAADRALTPPAVPEIDTGAIATPATLHIRGVKAQTGVAAALLHTASIPALPAIAADQVEVAAGDTARIVVSASHEGDRYELVLDGQPVKRARNGDGDDIAFITDPIDADTRFEMRVTRPDEAVAVTRVVFIDISVRSEPEPEA